MRVAALGRTRMMLNAIHAVRDAGHDVVLVGTCRAAAQHPVREADFERCAAELGVEYLFTQSLNAPEVVDRLRAVEADVAVSVNWVNLIGPAACAAFPLGILNAHAGDLPRFRGSAPVPWAMLLGEPRVGLVVHRMDPHEYDAGTVLARDFVELTPTTYVGDVFAALERLIPGAFVSALATLDGAGVLEAETAPPPAHGPGVETIRCYPRLPADGLIDWRHPAEFLARLVRASAEPYAGAFTSFRGTRLTVWRARVEPWAERTLAVPGHAVWRDTRSGHVAIATGDGNLVLEDVETSAGRGRPADVLRSGRDRLAEGDFAYMPTRVAPRPDQSSAGGTPPLAIGAATFEDR